MPLSVPGPYIPMAMVPARVAKRILDLEYMEMAEIAAEDDPAQSIHWLPSRLVSPSNHEYITVAGALLCDGGYFGHQISPKSPIVIYQRAE